MSANFKFNNICITSGNLGINVPNPTYNVHISGINGTNGVLYSNNTSATVLQIGTQLTPFNDTLMSVESSAGSSLIEFGNSPLTTNGMAQIKYNHVGDGSGSNYVSMGLHGGTPVAFLGNGYTGIGTTTPSYPLHVNSVNNNAIAAFYYYLVAGGFGGQIIGSYSINGCIFAAQRILSNAGFLASSDIRIKKEIVPIDTSNALNLINKCNPVKYKYIDNIKNPSPTLGFIAQEINNVSENLLHQKKQEFVPNIFLIAEIIDKNVLICDKLLENEEDIKINSKLKLYKEDDSILIVSITDIKSHENKTYITIDEELTVDSIFVYGTEIHDFNLLNYDSLFTLSISALQELDKQMEENKLLEKEIDNTINEIQNILTLKM